MSSSDAVLTTLLLQKGVVRCYSNLDSDVGKRVVITDKFNPLSVKEGTLDASLNLLYELPAFTTYNVKMYGLDGETVESNQDFKLDGYSYVEMNVGLNKNSFAGIKAIVDQGLESTMLQVGDHFIEADPYDENCRWNIVAIDYNPENEGYNHNVMIARHYLSERLVAYGCAYLRKESDPIYSLLENSYYGGLSQSIKDSITARKIMQFKSNTPSSAGGDSFIGQIEPRKVWNPCYSEFTGERYYVGGTYWTSSPTKEVPLYPKMPPLASICSRGTNEHPTSANYEYTRSPYDVYGNGIKGEVPYSYVNDPSFNCSTTSPYLTASQRLVRPCMMIASDPIE